MIPDDTLKVKFYTLSLLTGIMHAFYNLSSLKKMLALLARILQEPSEILPGNAFSLD